MSCTENESGPFVVFFLPAVVGCLTILLARRWANSQVTSGSTTAVSRRRKIIKDPLIKRPLPPVTCKMVSSGSKKSTGSSKKITVADDDCNVAKKIGRLNRSSPSSSPNGNSEIKKTEASIAPKHIPFPSIPQDGDILFEIMTFIFLLTATGLQYLNLYRSMWWGPHSHTSEALHFHLIDPHLFLFIIVIISRRLLFKVGIYLLRSFVAPKIWPHAVIGIRLFVLGIVLGALAWCTYFIAHKYPLIKLFYLCYPVIIYFLLFGLKNSPFLELNNTETPILHCCSQDPEQVRVEVDLMRLDFNMRVKKIIFNSVIGAYYTSFIPCCFAQPILYYDVYGAAQQVVFVWGAIFLRLASHLLNAQYCDISHRASLHLGVWQKNNAAWRSSDVPDAEPATTPAQSTGPAHTRFYLLFKNPSTLLCGFVCLQISLIVVQLCLLFSSIVWHGFLSIFLLLFLNYYTMFKLVRDYLIACKVYHAERMIQEKNNMASS